MAFIIPDTNLSDEPDFPILKQFECTSVAWFLKSVSRMDRVKKHLLARCLLKRSHSYAVAILNETSSSEEIDLTDWYIRRGTLGFETGERIKLKPTSIGKPLPRREIRKRLLAFLGTKIGSRAEYDAPNFLALDLPFPKAIVRTVVSMGGQKGDLVYWQELLTVEGTRITTQISILSWLGISSQTGWENVTEANIEQTLEALQTGCSIFLSAVPNLIK